MATELQKQIEKLEVQNILAKWAAEAAVIEQKNKAYLAAQALAQEPGDGLVDMDLAVKNVQNVAVDPVPKKIKSPFGSMVKRVKPVTPIRYLNPSTSQEEKSTKSSPSTTVMGHPLEDLF